jgi:sulfur-carrier protein adenylyltransferase/sulfurtransferase
MLVAMTVVDAPPLSSHERERYQRHLSLPEIGTAGQERLKAARVLVVGAGGLGSPAALYLAAAGCGTLGLIDYDRVELSNLQRQVLFDSSAVGESKAARGAERLAALNPDIRINAHAVRLTADNVAELFAQYDLILDGTDRLSAHYLINDACVLLQRPLVAAAIHRFEGQVMTYVPGRGACYRCAFPEGAQAAVGNCAEAGVLGVLPGVLGTLQATEAIKLLTGIGVPLLGRLLTYDALEMRFAEFRISRRRDCAACGDHPTITLAEHAMAASNNSSGIRRISAQQLHALLDSGAPTLLVDVREPDEFDAGHLPGSLHIPLGELDSRLQELSAHAAPIFICRSGGRSLAACQMALAAAPASTPTNLEGGLKAWAAEVDPKLRVL